jgi:hypothetical protein
MVMPPARDFFAVGRNRHLMKVTAPRRSFVEEQDLSTPPSARTWKAGLRAFEATHTEKTTR